MMADAKKCDRCGKLYEIREPNAFESLLNSLGFGIPESRRSNLLKIFEDAFDLCPACEKNWKHGLREKEIRAWAKKRWIYRRNKHG